MSRVVRIYDFEHKTTSEIPESELAPGFVKATVVGIEGEVYIAGSKAQVSEYRNPPFDAEARKEFALFAEIFADVHPLTVEQWEDGFRRDQHPEKEIDIWKKIAAAYLHFTVEKKVPDAAKKDYFNIILSCVTNGCDEALEVVDLRRISKARARGVVREISAYFVK